MVKYSLYWQNHYSELPDDIMMMPDGVVDTDWMKAKKLRFGGYERHYSPDAGRDIDNAPYWVSPEGMVYFYEDLKKLGSKDEEKKYPLPNGNSPVTNAGQALVSIPVVTGDLPYGPPEKHNNRAKVETHFIELETGKYLGESQKYYKKANETEVITFKKLKINIRSILLNEWRRNDFSHISDPLNFEEAPVSKNIKDIIRLTEVQKLVLDENNRPVTDKAYVQQCFVYLYELGSQALKSVLLPANLNTPQDLLVFNALVKSNKKGSYLVDDSLWNAALADAYLAYTTGSALDANGTFYNNAVDHKDLIVIGYGHTHPLVYLNDQKLKEFSETDHTETDKKISSSTKLPDHTFRVSSYFKKKGDSIVSAGTEHLGVLLTKNGFKNNLLPKTFDELYGNIEKYFFTCIVKQYKD